MPLRPLDVDSGSAENLERAAAWVEGCVDGHENCAVGSTSLPSRVLDIGLSGNTIRLVDGSAGLSGRYACLSYCWGSAMHFTTSRESIVARQKGIELSELPKTFYDAVAIARHLGLRYLWIDSLCICQGDAEEWARESSRMIDVYSNAHIVIAANHAEDSSVGCFHTRASRPNCVVDIPGYAENVQVMLLYNRDEWNVDCGEFEGEALTERGWALQERVLAKRVLNYGTRQMYFECNHGIVAEDGSSQAFRFGNLTTPNIQAWNGLLWAYGQRKLTKATDKFPAMSGLAKLFERALDAQYVAGLWSNNIIEGLSWQGLGRRQPTSTTQYIGPSWSWASFDGIAALGSGKGWEDIAHVQDWHVELKSQANPYGELVDAYVRVKGPLLRLIPSETETTEHEVRLRRAGLTPLPRFRTLYTTDEDDVVSLDSEDAKESGEWRKWNLQVMILNGKLGMEETDLTGSDAESSGKDREQDKEKARSYGSCYGLVVDVCDTENTRAKRVGWMFLDGSNGLAGVIDNEKDWEMLTLI